MQQRQLWRSGALLSLLFLALPAPAQGDSAKAEESYQPSKSLFIAEIRRTSFGIPHIKALNEASLGFGLGYAYAEDNFCLIADEILTVSGQRSRYFDPSQPSYPHWSAAPNLESDFFFRSVNDEANVKAAWNAQTAEVRALLHGYAAGFNTYLDQTGSAHLPEACRSAPWVRKINEYDLIRMARRIALFTTSAMFVPAISSAQPPGSDARPAVASPKQRLGASNALAVGGDRSANGRGIVLGQPHLPWINQLRFYQAHLTIPGKLDVMGVTLPGMPVVGIGFTRNFAWSHTVNTSAHATLYALELDGKDPTRYLVDGRSIPMSRREISVQVRGPDGQLQTQTRTLYSTQYGPVLRYPDLGMEWSSTRAYAIRDANASNHRAIEQWYAMGKARSLDEVRQVNQRIVGNPWNNTVAADKDGRTLYLNISPTANVPGLAACEVEQAPVLYTLNTVTLDGSRQSCGWANEAGAPQPGIVAGRNLPALQNRDYVQNANDSAWLTNLATPLTGFAPLVSREYLPQGPRTRQLLSEVLAHRQALSSADLQDMALSDKAFIASVVQDDMRRFCASRSWQPDEQAACARIGSWDGVAGLNSNMGYVYLRGLWEGLTAERDGLWAVPFDPADPVATPRGLAYADPVVGAKLAAALGASAAGVKAAGIDADAKLGAVQLYGSAGRRLGIPGASDAMGALNTIDTDPPADGALNVTGGTSYLQVVGFDDNGPVANALLSYSQSANPASPHHLDQTERFIRKEWIKLPFSEAQIVADPAYSRRIISRFDLP
ncbi:penicillin acylase family protein [Pseudoduganella violacea]|uniref:Acyl-homoserine-lactone acylase n=1 Tax=Pseudoduganella violacea TaxID=1715466 RepID=A0A7W5FW00_9BURK|nr:penicillin acylase family protein [Pseudoduganella violacea]MBB3121311.1 acyl-homoserine-lactone acylase [Pseudoduganella violacea]